MPESEGAIFLALPEARQCAVLACIYYSRDPDFSANRLKIKLVMI